MQSEGKKKKKNERSAVLCRAAFQSRREGPTWAMLFLAAAAPLVTARGLKLYLWFKLRARVKTPEKGGGGGRKRFKS